jgi:hypothetical protein
VLEAQGRAQDAHDAFEAALRTSEELAEPLRETGDRALRAEILLALGRVEEARAILDDLFAQGYREPRLLGRARARGIVPPGGVP